jgi:hypothetical protein
MEVLQGDSLCSYLKQTKMTFFSFTKLENSRVEQILLEGVGTSGRWEGEERVSEGEYCKYFVHIYVKGKRIPAETI